MGQRLVTTFLKNGEKCMVTYHHWSGYTISAIGFATACLQVMKSMKGASLEDVICAMAEQRLISGVDEASQKILAQKGKEIPLQEDRNVGLCSVDEWKMEDLKSCTEMSLTINMDDETANIADTFGWFTIYDFIYTCYTKVEDALLDSIDDAIGSDFEDAETTEDRIELLKTCRDMNPDVIDSLIEELEELDRNALSLGYDIGKITYPELEEIISEIRRRNRNDRLYFKTSNNEIIAEFC